jgi:hypothetical protein
MAKIRKISVGSGLASVAAFHGFDVDADGNLIYTKSTNSVDIENGDQQEVYRMYEVSTKGVEWKINEDGELVFEYDNNE